MKNKTPLIIISIILGVALIMSIFLNALSNKYMKLDGNFVLDQWTGEVYHALSVDKLVKLKSSADDELKKK